MGLWDSQLGGGGGGTAEKVETPHVTDFGSLPPAAAHTDEIYFVENSSGVYLINRKNKGYYKSDGATWTPWEQDDAAADAIAAEATARAAADSAHVSAYPHDLLTTLQAQILRRGLGQ